MEKSFIAEQPEDKSEKKLAFDRGDLVSLVGNTSICGIITGMLLDINNSVTYRVSNEFYYASELVLEDKGVKKIPGFNGKDEKK